MKKIDLSAKHWNITSKISAFAGDNCATNFGGVNRNGQNNVFARLKQHLHRDIVGIGCNGHIVHNGFSAGCEQCPIDVEALVVNMYKHFHIHTLRVTHLKQICDDLDTVFEMLTNHSSSRFLSLYPALRKVCFLLL